MLRSDILAHRHLLPSESSCDVRLRCGEITLPICHPGYRGGGSTPAEITVPPRGNPHQQLGECGHARAFTQGFPKEGRGIGKCEGQ